MAAARRYRRAVRYEDVLADLGRARFERVQRGYAASEVDDFLSQTADRLRAAGGGSEIASIARDIEEARFTPEANGYEPFAVRGLLTRTAASLKAQLERPTAGGRSSEATDRDAAPDADETIDRTIDRLASYEHELAERLEDLTSRAATHGKSLEDDVAHLREEIAVAGETLRDLLRQITSLRRRAREELRREIHELRAQWLADLDAEIAAASRDQERPAQREL